MDLSPRVKLRIAIGGGGIAGLTVAALLAKSADIELHVFDAKPEIRAIGAGIAIWKRYWDILEEGVNIGSECSARGLKLFPWPEVRGPVLRKADISSRGVDFSSLPFGPRLLPRDALLDILHKHINTDRCDIQTSKKIVSWEQHGSKEVVVYFQDGTSIIVDLLIGADGVHSCIRQRMFQGNQVFSDPEFSGQFAYRMTYPRAEMEELEPDNESLRGFKIWCGNGRHVTSNTVRDEIQMTAYDNFFDSNGLPLPFEGPWVAEVPASEVAERYDGWESDLISLLQQPKVASRWAIHVVHPLPTFVAKRVCLIGDAAHAMTPHQGLGGGQGIEDAYILALLLAHPKTTVSNLPEVLGIYDAVRRPSSQKVARQSLANGRMYAFLDPKSRKKSLKAIGEDMVASCRWLLEEDGVKKEWLRAQSMLAAFPTLDERS